MKPVKEDPYLTQGPPIDHMMSCYQQLHIITHLLSDPYTVYSMNIINNHDKNILKRY